MHTISPIPQPAMLEGSNVSALASESRSVAGSSRPSSGKARPPPRNVSFELLLDKNKKVKARIPLRVQIFPHDATDSIVTTVKEFFGIYEGAGSGVSFEDEKGNTLIARYENLRNNMTVYVNVIPLHGFADTFGSPVYYGASPMRGRGTPNFAEPYHMVPAQPAQILDYGQSISRPASPTVRNRSNSPSNHSRRSGSTHKGISRSEIKSRGSSTHGSFHDDAAAGYSDSDCGHGSISGSKRARSEQFASSEISMENIIQDSRRKRPKFESSELPLFAPPQVPLTTSTSSISPQRRSTGQEGPSPFARPGERPYNIQPPLPSPQSYGHSDHVYGFNGAPTPLYATPVISQHGHRLRERPSGQSMGRGSMSGNRTSGQGILPTPDPTIASCISDEDVAMQLIRLGDASNFSHGRTSASTLDDAFSGAADASSDTDATSDGAEASSDDEDLPPRSRHKYESSPMLPPGMTKRIHKNLDEILPSCDSSDPSGDEIDGEYDQDEQQDGLIKSEFDDYSLYLEQVAKAKRAKQKSGNITTGKPRNGKPASSVKSVKAVKNRPSGQSRKSKAPASGVTPKPHPAPMTSPASSHKAPASTVNFHHQLAADEEDLSTKPRCQRCRKSKKGCDRQRPCQRCKDAGIGIEGCISEDEGNGRKGRYGRHMGVPVKKSAEDLMAEGEILPAEHTAMDAATLMSVADKSKKRKR